MVNYKHKLDIISSKVEEAEKVLKTKKGTQKKIIEMIKNQEAAEQEFSLRNLKSDPVYKKAVSQHNHELIQKLKNRSITPEEYDLELRYDTIRSAGRGYKYVTKQGKEGLVNENNEEVLAPIYDYIRADLDKFEYMNKSEVSTRGIVWAAKGDEMSYFDSFDGFKKIDITGYNGIKRGNANGYSLYKVEGKKSKEKIEREFLSGKNNYILCRDSKTDEIKIIKWEWKK